MENIDKHIEENIKQQLGSENFDLDAAWLDDMSSKLDQYNQKKKRRFGFWWLFAGLGLSISGASYYLLSSNQPIASSPTSIIQNKTTIHHSNLKNANKSSISENAFCKELTEKNHSNNSQVALKNTNSPSYKKNKHNNNVYTNVPVQAAQNYTTFKQNTQTTSSSNLTILTAKNNEQNSESLVLNNTTASNEKLASTVSSQTTIIAKSTLNSILETQNLNSNTSTMPNDSLLTNQQSKDSLENEKVNLANEILSTIKTEENVPKEVKKQNKDLGLSLTLEGGTNYMWRTYSSETQHQKRETEEENRWSWSAQMNLSKTFNNNLIIGTGIGAAAYGEKINYTPLAKTLKIKEKEITANDYFNVNITKINQLILRDTSAILYYDTNFIYRDSTFYDTSLLRANGNTNFTFIEIPLYLGYRILNTSHIEWNINTGISAGFLVHSKGNYIQANESIGKATNKGITWNYLLSTQLKYKLTNTLGLSISPYFKYQLNNQSPLDATKRKYTILGIHGGIVLDF